MSFQLRLSLQCVNRLHSQYLQKCYASTVCLDFQRRCVDSPHHAYPKSPCLITRHSRLYSPATCQFHQRRHASFQEKLSYYYSPDFAPVGYAQKLLEVVHDSTGLPWWGTLLLTTAVLRVVITVPVFLIAQWNLVKLQKVRPELAQKAQELSDEVTRARIEFGWNEKTALMQFNKNMRRIVRETHVRENCHPMKSILVFWSQVPIWISLSLALRNMSGHTPFGTLSMLDAVHPEMSNEGILWFTNLMVPDPTMMLPVILTVLSLTNIEVMTLSTVDSTNFQKFIFIFFRGISICLFPLAVYFPSAVVYYWACSGTYALTQSLVILSPKVRTFLKLPEIPNQSKTPYRQLIARAKQRYGKPFRRKDKSDGNS